MAQGVSKSLQAVTIEAERTQVMPMSLKATEAKRPMRFRPSTGKRRIIGRKSHQLVPDEVQEVPKSLPTTGVTRPNNVGRTFTLRRKLDTLGHGLASWATSVAQQPKPAKTGHHRKDLAERRHSATKSLWERQRGAAVDPAEADRGPVRTEHHGTKEEFSPGDFIKPRFSYHEGFQELFPSRTV